MRLLAIDRYCATQRALLIKSNCDATADPAFVDHLAEPGIGDVPAILPGIDYADDAFAGHESTERRVGILRLDRAVLSPPIHNPRLRLDCGLTKALAIIGVEKPVSPLAEPQCLCEHRIKHRGKIP